MANPQREDGHVDLANDIVEAFAQTQLSGYESRVVMALLRRTWGQVKRDKKGRVLKDKKGWILKKQKAVISSKNWVKLTGLNKYNVSRTLRQLELRQIVIKNDNKTEWRFQKDYDKWLEPIKRIVIKNDNTYFVIKNDNAFIKNDNGIIKIDNKLMPRPAPRKQQRATKKTLKENLKDSTNTTKQEQKIIFNFDTEKWKNIKPKNIEDWDKAYPACDIKLELSQMKEWLLSNPSKRKANYRRFITNWLARSQEKGGSKKGDKKLNERKVFNQALESLNLYYTKNKLLAWLSKLPEKYHTEFQKYPDFEEVEEQWRKQESQNLQ